MLLRTRMTNDSNKIAIGARRQRPGRYNRWSPRPRANSPQAVRTCVIIKDAAPGTAAKHLFHTCDGHAKVTSSPAVSTAANGPKELSVPNNRTLNGSGFRALLCKLAVIQ